jgi:transposase
VSSEGTNQRQDDLADVRAKLQAMAAEGRVDALIELVMSLLIRVREENTGLAARLQSALRMLYGRKSEKVSAEQLSLMLDALGPEAPDAAREAVKEESEPPPPSTPPNPDPKPPRLHKGRGALPEHLPRRQRIIPVPEAERRCAGCGAEKTCIGHIRSEILDFVPAQFVVVEEAREKLACPVCQEGVVAAPSEKVMDRGRPGPGLLAKIVVDKFEDSTPLYRQAKECERLGVRLSPSTLGDWSAFALDVLAPIGLRIPVKVLESLYVRCDDTGIRVLERDHPQGVKRGHLWAYVGGGLVAFDYTPNWKAEGPAAFLSGFRGYLQGDGYAGFDKALRMQAEADDDGDAGIALVPAERRLGCGMHVRRKFEDATKMGDARGAVALSFLKGVYRLESEYKDRCLSPEARLAERAARSMPLVNELYAWIKDIHGKLVPKTPLYRATRYALKHEAAWRLCFTQGYFEIDNGEVERRLRWVALGRKNYLFAGSDKGAERLAIGYTLTGSCHMNGVNPLAYMTDVIGKLQSGWPKNRLDELLPNVWKPGGSPRDG